MLRFLADGYVNNCHNKAVDHNRQTSFYISSYFARMGTLLYLMNVDVQKLEYVVPELLEQQFKSEFKSLISAEGMTSMIAEFYSFMEERSALQQAKQQAKQQGKQVWRAASIPRSVGAAGSAAASASAAAGAASGSASASPQEQAQPHMQAHKQQDQQAQQEERQAQQQQMEKMEQDLVIDLTSDAE